MNLRTALIEQSPSLALQRAASDEISKLDYKLNQMTRIAESFNAQLELLHASLGDEQFNKLTRRNVATAEQKGN